VTAFGLPAPGVMLSSGGMRPASLAARGAASLALSGPAGGVIAAAAFAERAGIAQALSIDIGGTSADVGLILDAAPVMEPGGSIAGVPIALPRVLVETVSAGGGSVGWIDSAGVLRVGPRSAGMTPGPAAFGRGGTEATVTDAHVVLGNITDTHLSAGVTLDNAAAMRAVSTLATKLNQSVEPVAEAMIAIADAEMARALRRLSVDRGIDPRESVLIAFGGGGALHACGLADRMSMRTVLVPPHAGVLSALGLATASEQRSATRSVMRLASECDASFVQNVRSSMLNDLRLEESRAAQLMNWARCRYKGQGHQLEVGINVGDSGIELSRRFTNMHQKRYGFALAAEVEIVSIRCMTDRPSEARAFRGEPPAEQRIRGRKVLALPDSTLLVAAEWTAVPHHTGGWLLEREG
jgi:N-methylhydantoinase A/oxoprolinase/acetone carboxylase beta subunit